MNESKRNGVACYYCRRKFDDDNRRTKDHAVAHSKGGFDTEENYVDCCWDCNQWKAAKSLEQWMTEVKRWLDYRKHSLYTKIQLGQMVGNIKKLIAELKDNRDISVYKPK